MRQGFLSLGAVDNTVIIFPELMDSNSLFLQHNADIIYTRAALDMTKCPLLVEIRQPLDTIDYLCFGWVIDIGFPRNHRAGRAAGI
jgi:hypothetical protein